MWLGYGRGYTFPDGDAEAWKTAGREHEFALGGARSKPQPRLAAVRPYTVRALRDVDGHAPADSFFTETILYDVVVRKKWAYDPLEPIDGASLDPAELRRYPLVLAEVGELTGAELAPYVASGVPCALFITGADRFSIDPAITGISRSVRVAQGSALQVLLVSGEPVLAEAADLYEVDPGVEVMARVGAVPCAWRKGNLLFVAFRSERRDGALPAWLWKTISSAF